MPQRYVVSEFTTVSWRDGGVQIASAVSGTTFTSRDAFVLGLLSAFAMPQTIDDVVREHDSGSDDAAAVIGEWIEAAILVDADMPELAALHHWDRESLALHTSSRYRKWHKKRSRASAPAVAARRSELTIPLAPGPASGSGDLAALLETRSSRRVWGDTPIAFEAFSALFWMSARNRPTDREGYVSRPYPSGGAAYSLELYPVIADHAVGSLSSGVYRYLAEEHALEAVAPFGAESHRILVAAGRAMSTTPPPVAILITSRYARQSEQYTTLAYSLVLKEVGCLFQTLYLAAESLGLAACALGRGAPAGLLARVCGTTEIEEPVVGELALGVAAE